MCEEKSEQGHGRHCTEEWPEGLPWVPKNRPLQSAVEAVVPEEMIVSPSAPQQLAAALEQWADMKEDETCPERRSLGYCKTTGYAKIWSGVRTAGLVPADTGPALETIPRDSSAAETLCDSGRSQD